MVLPLKAVAKNLLSIAVSFGALVWIFEEGHLGWLVRCEPGATDITVPILLAGCLRRCDDRGVASHGGR